MANIRFYFENLLDLAALTESSEADGLPAENVQHPFRTKVWRTAGAPAGTANLVIDHGSAKAVGAVILADYNWAAAPGTLDLEFHTADNWVAPDETEELTWVATPDAYGNRNVIVKTFGPHTYRYNRLNVVNAPGDFDLGRIFLGSYFEPTNQYNFGGGEQPEDPSLLSQSVGGQDHADVLSNYRTKKISFPAETEAQWRLMQEVYNTVGKAKDLFVSFDPDTYPNDLTWYCKFMDFRQKGNFHKRIDMGFKESR